MRWGFASMHPRFVSTRSARNELQRGDEPGFDKPSPEPEERGLKRHERAFVMDLARSFRHAAHTPDLFGGQGRSSWYPCIRDDDPATAGLRRRAPGHGPSALGASRVVHGTLGAAHAGQRADASGSGHGAVFVRSRHRATVLASSGAHRQAVVFARVDRDERIHQGDSSGDDDVGARNPTGHRANRGLSRSECAGSRPNGGECRLDRAHDGRDQARHHQEHGRDPRGVGDRAAPRLSVGDRSMRYALRR